MTGISVIIPTLNRSDFLQQTLGDLLSQQTDLPLEIIVVDQSDAEDNTLKQLSAVRPEVNYHHVTDFRGLPQARNYGASVANFDYLLFLDDDIGCGPELLQSHFNAIRQHDCEVVAGGIIERHKKEKTTGTGQFNYHTAAAIRGFDSKKPQWVDHAGGGNFLVKKQAYFQAGGTDEQFAVGASLYEETDLCLRIKRQGGNIWFEPTAAVEHLAGTTGGVRLKDMEQYLEGLCHNRALMIKRHVAGFYRPWAYLLLFKTVLAYAFHYRSGTLLNCFFKARYTANRVDPGQVKHTFLKPNRS